MTSVRPGIQCDPMLAYSSGLVTSWNTASSFDFAKQHPDLRDVNFVFCRSALAVAKLFVTLIVSRDFVVRSLGVILKFLRPFELIYMYV